MALKIEPDSLVSARSASVLIIGGGTAGMAAAGSLSSMGIGSIVVETKQKIGGLAAELACKGSRECVRCDVCLGTERAKDASKSPDVRILTESQISGVKGRAGDFIVEITDRQGIRSSYQVQGIIVCTGIEPIDPRRLSRYSYGYIPGVASALDVERQLSKMGKWEENDLKRMAFIQCVGSRGEKGGVEYCSTVCCKYALKLAKALTNQYPDSQISFFLMDWRSCDGAQKDLQAWADSPNVKLIRSRPAEIFQSGEGKPMIRYATQQEDIVDEEFDLVVLSVGIEPSQGTVQVGKMLGIDLDEDGFIKTPLGSTQTSIEGICAAGTACGPCDIERSVTSGIAAATEAAANLRRNGQSGTIAMLGRIDDDLVNESRRQGLNLIQVPWDKSPNLKLELSGRAGDFLLRELGGSVSTPIHCGALIVSLSADSCSAHPGIISLEKFEELSAEEQSNTVFILQESIGCSARSQHHERALRGALRIKEDDSSKIVTIIAPEFLAFAQLERLYKQCQERGVLFIRQNEFPKIANGHVEVFDPTSGVNLHIAADRVVVGGDQLSSETRERLLSLRLNVQDDGRLENRPIKWKPSGSLKKGVYICGSPWGTEESRRLDQMAALGEALALLRNPRPSELLAKTEEKKCSACLSCVRTCPFEAPYINSEGLAEIDSELCQGCGVCVGVCPSSAISLGPRERGG